MASQLPSSGELVARYVRLNDELGALRDRYFPVRAYQPGQAIKPGEMITPEALDELKELEDEVERARADWMRAASERR